MSEQKPSVGRVVHYVSYGTPGGEYGRECRAAIITEVPRDTAVQRDGTGNEVERRTTAGTTVGLCVLNPTGQFFNRAVPHDDGGETADHLTALCTGMEHDGGSWHWPAKV